MSSYNVKLAASKLPGATVKLGKNGDRWYLIIPIDNQTGIVQNGTTTSMGEARLFEETYINLQAIELEKPKFGQTHILKGSVSKEKLETMKEEDLNRMPIVGNMRPWGNYRKVEKGPVDDGDMPDFE